MHVQVLGSGSRGNCVLVRAGEAHVLVDAGLPLAELEARLETARVSPRRIDHIVLTHGHLDHARSAGALAKKAEARVHCATRMMKNASVRRAPKLVTLPIGATTELRDARERDTLVVSTVRVPHDAEPTVALRLEAGGRVAVLVTDMGHPRRDVAKRLAGAHLLLLEFNHDPDRLRQGAYSASLKKRVAGKLGHLSNAQASEMLGFLESEALHTLVLTHISENNNTPGLAHEAARAKLEALGRDDVRVLAATQDEVGPNLAV